MVESSYTPVDYDFPSICYVNKQIEFFYCIYYVRYFDTESCEFHVNLMKIPPRLVLVDKRYWIEF